MTTFKQLRDFMKSNFSEWSEELLSDQQKKLPQPPLEKPYDVNAEIINLPQVMEKTITQNSLFSAINKRKSTRVYAKECLSLDELSFLLYSTQGVKKVNGENYATIRPVPSGGARHPFETYLVVQHIDGLRKGVYRYLALSHQLQFLFEDENSIQHLSDYALEQPFVGDCAVTFIWSCIPYRGEWRYMMTAHKVMLLDAGHVCQNLYLACEGIGCGTCAIAAYDQKAIDGYLGLDGDNEFVIYMAPVGKLK